jgi:hypothetical protein
MKSRDTFALGWAVSVTADEIPDPHELGIRLLGGNTGVLMVTSTQTTWRS